MALATCTDVGTTPRKRLSPKQKTALYEAQGGICPLCSRRMERGEKLIDEHMTALGLGGGNDKRAIVHAECAYAKTYGSEGDLAKIAEAKRRKAKSLGFTAPKQPIRSAGFPATARQHSARPPAKGDLPALPRPSLFVPA